MTTVIERLGVRARPGVSPASGTKGDAVSPLVKIMKFDIFSMAAPIVAVGLAAEVLLPYGLLWLSDEFLFDIPDWALWFAFGGPPVAGMATFLGIRKHFFFEKKKQKTFAN